MDSVVIDSHRCPNKMPLKPATIHFDIIQVIAVAVHNQVAIFFDGTNDHAEGADHPADVNDFAAI